MKWIYTGTAVLLTLILTVPTVTMAYGMENGGVPLNNVEFPDAAFLMQIQEKDRDGDGLLSQEELDAVTELDLRKAGIRSLDGLKWFRSQEALNCSENDLETLVLPDLPRLTSLTCNENPNLSQLDLTGAPALEHLYCFHSSLTELDLHTVPNLAYLAWGGSPLAALDLSGNPHLLWLHVLGGDLDRAEAAFGTVQFSYGADPSGPFQPEPPAQAGSWYVQAEVEQSDDWTALEDTARFEIHPAMPSYPQPAKKTAVYGDRLSEVSLEPGFLWESADAWVGNAGLQNHLASFVPADPVDYLTVEHIPVEVEVLPYDGTLLPIPNPANPEEAEHLGIHHGDWILQEGRDYVTQIASGQVTIQFRGNYTGNVTRSFPTTGGSSSGSVQKDRLILLDLEHGTLHANPAAPSAGTTVRIALEPEPGYQAGDVTAVDPRGTVLPVTRMDDGSYSFSMVRGTVTVTGAVRPRVCSRNYVDVSPDSWYADAVGFLCRTGWMIGVDAQHFAPDAPLSRGMMMEILYRQAGSPPSRTAPFTDVPQDAFYADAVAWAAAHGVTVGDGHAKFYPELPLTREELVTVLWRKAGSPTANVPDSCLDGFADGAQTAPWAEDAWSWALADGLMVGRTETQLAPKEPVTRAESAVILARQMGFATD